jgi:hypothetical protein
MLSLAGVVGGIFKTFRDAMALSEEMAAKQRESMPGIGPLAQLAMGDKNRMRELIKSTRESYAQGAGLTLGEAGKMQFEIASANFEKYRREIAELKATSAVPDPIGLVVGAAALETNIGPKAGGFPRITSMLMGAAGKSPGEIPNIALASAEAAGTGVFLGLSPQEIMAASAVAAKASGSPEDGGMLMKNLFEGIEGAGLQKGGLTKRATLTEYMEDIAALEATGKRDYEILGNDLRTYMGYRKLKAGLDIYKQTLGEIDSAVETDMFHSTAEMWKVSPEMIGARAERQSQAGKELAFDREGTFANLAKAVRNDLMVNMQQRQDEGEYFWKTPLRPVTEDAINAAEQWLNGPEAFVAKRGGQASAETQEMIRLTYEALRESAEFNRESAAVLNNAIEGHVKRQRAAVAGQPE